VHGWLYLLLLTFTLFGINLMACSIDTFIRLINNRAGRLKASAALLFHVALLVTMVAHLYEGFYASTERTMINEQERELAEIGTVRMESLKNIYHPDNTQKDAEVTLLFDRPDGQHVKKEIAFNEPAIFDGGRRQVVMLTAQKRPAGVIIHSDKENRSYHFMPDKPQHISTGLLVLQGLFQDRNRINYAQFLWMGINGQQQQLFMVLDNRLPQKSQININGTIYRFQELVEMPFIVAIIRHNPAIPLILLGLILASFAVILLIVWIRNRIKIRNARGTELQ
jgi:hypothetical protein